MTRRLLSVYFKKTVAALLASSASALTYALSFDSVMVFSHLGEPLHAEIPVIFDAGESEDSSLFVRAALPSAYADAHIPFHDELLTIHYHLEKKADHQFALVATSDQPIDTPMLVALVEVTSQGSRFFKELAFSIDSDHPSTDRDHKGIPVDFRFDGALNIAPSTQEMDGGSTPPTAGNEQNQVRPVVVHTDTPLPTDIARNPEFLQHYIDTSNLNVSVELPSSPAVSTSVPTSGDMSHASVNLGVPTPEVDSTHLQSRAFDRVSSPQYAAMPTSVPNTALDQLHRVRPGETLSSVAQLFLYPDVSLSAMADAIAERNSLSPASPLQPGSVLVIPSCMSVKAMASAHAAPVHPSASVVKVKPRVMTNVHHHPSKTTHHRSAHHDTVRLSPHTTPATHKKIHTHTNRVKVSKAVLENQPSEEDMIARRRSVASVDEMQKKIDAEIQAIEQHKKSTPAGQIVASAAEQSGVTLPVQSASSAHPTLSPEEALSPFERMMRDYGDLLPYLGIGLIIVLVLVVLLVMKSQKKGLSASSASPKESFWRRLFQKKKNKALTSLASSSIGAPETEADTSVQSGSVSVEIAASPSASRADVDQAVVFHAEEESASAPVSDQPSAGESSSAPAKNKSLDTVAQVSDDTSSVSAQHPQAVQAPAEVPADQKKDQEQSAPSPAVAEATSSAVGQEEQGDDLDPIAEAGVYMAYGRLGQAEELLSDALRKNPQNQDIRLKLMDVFSQQKNVVAFSQEAALYHESCQGKGDAWHAVAELGRQFDPDNTLYHSSSTSLSSQPVASIPEPTLAASEKGFDDVAQSGSTSSAKEAVQESVEEELEPLDLSVDLEEASVDPVVPEETTKTGTESNTEDEAPSKTADVADIKPAVKEITTEIDPNAPSHLEDDGSEFIVSMDDQPNKK